MNAREVLLWAFFIGLLIVWVLPFLIGKAAAFLLPVWLVLFCKLAANSLCPSCGKAIPKMKGWFSGNAFYEAVIRGCCNDCPERQ